MAAYPSEFLSIEGIEAWEHAQAELDREKIATMASQTLVLHRQQKCRQQGGLPNKPTSNRNLQDAGHALAGLEFAGQMASAVTNAGLRKTHGAATCLAAHARFVAVGTDNGCVLVARNVDETTGRVPPEDASSKSTNDPRPFILGTAGTPDGSVTSLGFNPMGDWLASGYSTGAVNLWDLQRGSLLKGGIGAHHTAVIQLAFVPSPPQRANRVVGVAAPLAWLLTCDCGGTVLLHSLVTMPLMRRITAQHTAVLEGSPAGGGATSVLALATLTVIADPRHLIPLALQQHLSSLDGQASGQARSSDASAHAADAGAAAQAAKTSGRSLFPLLLPGVPDAGTTGGGSGTGGSSSGTGGGSGATAPAQDVGDVLAGAGIFALATWQSLIVARLFPEMEVLLRLPRDHLQGANCMAYLAWQPTAFLPASFMTQSAQSAPRNQQQSQQQRTQLHPQQPRAGGQSSHPSSEPASAASSAASSPSFAALASATSTLAPPPGGQGPRHRPSSVSLASAQSSPPAARQGDANAAGGVTGASGGLAALESPLMIGREVLLAVAQGRVVQVLSIEVTFASTASAGVTNALLGKQAAGTGARGGAGGSSGGGGGSAGCPPLEVTPRVRASWPLDADAAGVAWVSQPCSLLAVATVQEEILFFLCPGRSLGSAGSRAWNQRGSAGVSNSAGAMADSGAVASAGGTASASSGRSRGDVGAVAQAVQQQQQQEEEEVVDGGIQPLVRIGIGVQAHPSGGPGFSPGAGLGSLAHHDWLRNSYGTPERAFHGAVAVKGLGPDLLCLGGSCLQLVRLRGWRERLHAMASGAEWMEALAFGLDVFNGAALPPPYGYLAGSPMAGDGHPTPNSDGVPTRIGGGGQGQLIGGSWATEVRPRLHQGPWSEHDHRGEGGAAASASGSGGGGEVGGDGLQGTFINARGMVLPGVVDTAAILVLWPRVRADVRPVLVSLLRRYLEWVVEAAEREAMSEAMRRSERMAARERQVAVGGGSKVGSSGAHVAADRAHGQGMSRGETREGAGDGVAAGLGTGGSSVGLGDEAAGDGASKDEVGEDRGDHRDAGSGAGGAGCGGGGGGGPASVKEEEEEEEEEDIVELIRARFALASQASIEFCLSLGEAGLLFEDVYPLMSSAGQRDTFVGHLEPYVLSDQLVCMPPEIMQALVGLYSRGGPGGVGPFAPHPGLSGAGVRGGGGRGKAGVPTGVAATSGVTAAGGNSNNNLLTSGGLNTASGGVNMASGGIPIASVNMLERVERCVLHMDIASLDFNQVLPLCLRHGLYSALAYLFNVGMGDYVTPLAEMYQAARRKAAAAGGGRASGQRTQAAAAAAAAGGPAAAAVTGGVATAPTRTDMGLSQAPAVHGLPPTPRNEGEAFLVYKLLVYLRFSFQGRPFPPGVPVSHLGAGGRGSANWRARCADLLTYLLGEDVGEGGGGHGGGGGGGDAVGNGCSNDRQGGGRQGHQHGQGAGIFSGSSGEAAGGMEGDPMRYPRLRYLLQFDCGATLQVLQEPFLALASGEGAQGSQGGVRMAGTQGSEAKGNLHTGSNRRAHWPFMHVTGPQIGPQTLEDPLHPMAQRLADALMDIASSGHRTLGTGSSDTVGAASSDRLCGDGLCGDAGAAGTAGREGPGAQGRSTDGPGSKGGVGASDGSGTRGRLGDGSGTRGLWRQFGGVSSMSHFVAEDAGAMLHFVAAVLLAPGSARLSPAALVRLLEYLALGPPAPEDSDRAEREELMVAVMEGSSRDALDLPWCAALTERARFCKACAMLLSWQGRRCDALACLLEDTGRTAEVYAYIRGVFAQAEREGTSQDRPIGTDTAGAASTREGISAFKQAVISHLPTLMARDGRGALRLVLRCLAREADALVRQLGSTPRLQYAILHGIMAAHLGGKQQPPALSQQPPPEALSQQAEGWQQKARSGEHRVPSPAGTGTTQGEASKLGGLPDTVDPSAQAWSSGEWPDDDVSNDEGDTEGSLVELLASSGVVVTEAMAELYVERLCEYDPGRVLPFLASGEGYHVERCLALCTKHGVTDGSVYLLEKMGDLAGALALVLRDLEAHLAAFASAVHAAKGRLGGRSTVHGLVADGGMGQGVAGTAAGAGGMTHGDDDEDGDDSEDDDMDLDMELDNRTGATSSSQGGLFRTPGGGIGGHLMGHTHSNFPHLQPLGAPTSSSFLPSSSPPSLSSLHRHAKGASLRVSPQRAALALLTQSLESGIHLCRRSAHRLPSADYEELWFQLVDTLVLALRRAKGASLGGSGALFSAPGTAPLGSRQQQPVTASRDGSQRGQGHAVVAVDSNKGAVVVSGKDKGAVSGEVGAQVATMEVSGGEVVGDWGRLQQRRAGGVLHRTLTSLLGDVMTSATECLPLQAVLRKLLAEHGRDELGDFRASILGMLASCGYEASILATAMSATADDAYRSVRQLQALHRGAMAIRAATCLACGMDMFTRAVAAKQSGADKEPGVASESGGGTSGQGRGLDGTLSSQGGDKPPGAGAAEGHKDSAKVVLFACGHGYHTACCAAQQKGATAKALSCRKCQASSGDAPQLGLSRWPPRVPRYVVAYM